MPNNDKIKTRRRKAENRKFPLEFYKSIFRQAVCSACYLLHAGFLHGVLFDPADGTDIFLRNIG
jgi:hypothetical protein